MGDENLDFERKIKELEREFNSSNNQQENEQTSLNTYNFDIQAADEQSIQEQPIAQEIIVNDKQSNNNLTKSNKKRLKEAKPRQTTNSNMSWNVMMFIGLVCFMLFFISSFAHFALGMDFSKVRSLSIIALIFAFIPLIYFTLTAFLKPGHLSQQQQNTIDFVASEENIEGKTNTYNISNNLQQKESDSLSVDVQAEFAKLENERRKLEDERRELEEKYSRYARPGSTQDTLERERRLLNERRFQIQNLMKQDGINWSEIKTLRSELENIEKELSENAVKISEAAEKAAAQAAIQEAASQAATTIESQGADIPNFDVKRKEFEEEIKTLKAEKLAISTEAKKVNKQLEAIAKKLELLRQKRALAHYANESKKVNQIDEQIIALKEEEIQQKTLAAAAKEKNSIFGEKVVDVRARMASVLTELKSRMSGYNEMQKIYTASMSLMKKTGAKKSKATQKVTS